MFEFFKNAPLWICKLHYDKLWVCYFVHFDSSIVSDGISDSWILSSLLMDEIYKNLQNIRKIIIIILNYNSED